MSSLTRNLRNFAVSPLYVSSMCGKYANDDGKNASIMMAYYSDDGRCRRYWRQYLSLGAIERQMCQTKAVF